MLKHNRSVYTKGVAQTVDYLETEEKNCMSKLRTFDVEIIITWITFIYPWCLCFLDIFVIFPFSCFNP